MKSICLLTFMLFCLDRVFGGGTDLNQVSVRVPFSKAVEKILADKYGKKFRGVSQCDYYSVLGQTHTDRNDSIFKGIGEYDVEKKTGMKLQSPWKGFAYGVRDTHKGLILLTVIKRCTKHQASIMCFISARYSAMR